MRNTFANAFFEAGQQDERLCVVVADISPAGAMDKFYMLKYGLALVLIFVGLKMVWLNDWYGGKFPISLSLGIISSVIAASVILSFLVPKRRAATGAVAHRDGS